MKKSLSLFLLSLPVLCLAQPNLPKPVADSLWHVWTDESQADTNRLKAIHKYAWNGYLFTKPDSAFYFAQLQYDFAQTKSIQKQKAAALNTQAVSYYFQGDYTKAIDYNTQSLKLSSEINDKKSIAFSLNNIGLCHINLGDFKAIDFFNQSLKINEEISDKRGISMSLNNIGLIHAERGEYAKSIYYYTQSLNIKIEIGDKHGTANSLNNLGNIYVYQGDYAKAIDYHSESLKIREEIGDKRGIATSLNNIGNIHINKGEFVTAIEIHTISLKIREEIGDKEGQAMSLINIGNIYAEQGESTIAIDYYNRSKQKQEEIGNKQGNAIALNWLGIVYKNQGNYDNAIKYSLESFLIASEIDAEREKLNAIHNLVIPYIRIDDISRSIEMTELLEFLRMKHLNNNFPILSEEEKVKYFLTMQEDFDLLFDFSIHHTNLKLQTEKAYNNALLTKGLTLKSSTAMRAAIQNSGDTSLINQYDDWLTLKKKISKLNEIDSTYKTLIDQANEMERELVKKSTIFSDFDKVKNLKWQDVQAGLKPNEAAIEFVHFKSEIDTAHPIIYAALIVKKDSKHPEMIRLCTEADLKEILGVFQGNNLSFVKGVYGTKSKAQKALYEKIWQPLEKHLEGIQNIYYSPSGLLHKVSFAAISKSDNVFLCDNYQLYQQSSTGKVALPTNVLYDAKDEFLLLGGVEYNSDKTKKEVWNYLPGTKTETENIQAFLQKKKHAVNFYASNDASEDNFKAQANKAHVLHISTHGFFYPDPEQVREEAKKDEIQEENIIFRGTNDPIAIGFDSAERSSSLYANWSFVINKNPLMRSGLVLAGANDVWQRDALAEGEDGILTAQEVSNLDLRNAKLVVLSACETGLGDIKGSEGVFGLQRAFKIAGAEYLIMSLWQVPDKETSEFMQLFYQNLTKVKDIPKAFNLTQQAMRKKYDPYYWAAFVLIN